MSDCCVNSPMRLLRGVTRTVTLTIKDASGVPLDLSAVELTVEVIRDGSGDKYVPTIAVEGEAHNLIVFTWPADKQKVGLHTIDVRGDFGVTGVSRTNWHGPDGIVIVEWARDTSAREVADLSVEEVSMTGTMETAAAASGGNYYVKPEGGIPASDLSQAVQDSLGLADTAYQKPQYGIPESDLAGEVKAKLKETLYISSLPTSDITSTDDLNDVISRSTLLKLAEGEASALIYNQLTEYGMSESDYAQTECVITKASKIVGDRNNKCELTFVLNGYEYAITADYDTRVATVTVTAVQDITNKADKVSGATNGNLAALDSNGNLTDSGKSASDFATAAQGAKADTSYQKPATGIPASDLAAGVIPTVPTDVVKYSQQSLTDEQKTQARTNIGAGTYSKPSGGIPASDIAPGVIPAGVTVDQTYDPTSQNAQSGVAMAGALAGKQDTINDLQTIRSGASAGATAYQKPQTGIPASDLAAGIIPTVPTDVVKYSSQSLTEEQKAQARSNIGAGTYSKPSGGIPASDLASGVIPTVPTALSQLSDDSTHRLVTDTEKNTWNGKQDAIVFNTAYNASSNKAATMSDVPTVPTISTDIASDGTSDTKTASPKAVKTFVEGKGYGTYSKPSGGIPAADIAAGVIPTVPTISTDIAADKASTTKTAAPSAVYNEVHPAFGSSQPSGGMLPNVLYKLGTLSGNTAFVLATPADANIANHYFWTFDTPSTAPTITWPASITSWYGGQAPTINTSKHYEVSLLDGVAICMEV